MAAPEDPGLRRLLEQHAEYFEAPADLRRDLLAAANRAQRDALHGVRHGAGARPRLPSWLALPAARLGIAFAAGACAALLAVAMLHEPPGDRAAIAALLSDHARALVTGATSEVASSSSHTVKPWLSARLGYSPNVVDLAEQGFPLVGGRRGFAGAAPIAVIVYAYREHEIDLYALRGAAGRLIGSRSDSEPQAQDGYNVRAWQSGGLGYVAISAVAVERLDEFVRRIRQRQSNPSDQGNPD